MSKLAKKKSKPTCIIKIARWFGQDHHIYLTINADNVECVGGCCSNGTYDGERSKINPYINCYGFLALKKFNTSKSLLYFLKNWLKKHKISEKTHKYYVEDNETTWYYKDGD